MIDISDGLKAPFRDEKWGIKLGIGILYSLLSIFILPIPVIYGYYVEIVKNRLNGNPDPLPEWKDPGIKFLTGVKYLAVILIYFLPLIVVVVPASVLLISLALLGGPGGDYPVSGFIAVLTVAAIVPYSIFIYLILPPITALFARNERIRDALEIGKVVKLFKSDWEDILLVSVFTIIIDLLAMFGLIFIIIGIFFTSFYAQIVRFQIYAQIAEEYKNKGLI